MIAWLKRLYCRVFGHRERVIVAYYSWKAPEVICPRCKQVEYSVNLPDDRPRDAPPRVRYQHHPVTPNLLLEQAEQAEQARLDILLAAIREDMANQRVLVADDSPPDTGDSGSGFGGGGATDSWTPDASPDTTVDASPDISTPDIDTSSND